MKSIYLWGFCVACLAGGITLPELVIANPGAAGQIELAEPTGLDKIVSLTFQRTPLQEALTEIAELSDLKLMIDGDALKMEGITKNISVNLVIKDAKLSDALRKVLDGAGQRADVLDYELRDEGKTLFVSTKKALKKPE